MENRKTLGLIEGEKSAGLMEFNKLLNSGTTAESKNRLIVVDALDQFFALSVSKDIFNELQLPLEYLTTMMVRLKELEGEQISHQNDNQKLSNELGVEGTKWKEVLYNDLSEMLGKDFSQVSIGDLRFAAAQHKILVDKKLIVLEDGYFSLAKKDFLFDELLQTNKSLLYWLALMMFKDLGETIEQLHKKLSEMSFLLQVVYAPASFNQVQVTELALKFRRLKEIYDCLRQYLVNDEKLSIDAFYKFLTSIKSFPPYIKTLDAIFDSEKSRPGFDPIKFYQDERKVLLKNYVQEKYQQLAENREIRSVVIEGKKESKFQLGPKPKNIKPTDLSINKIENLSQSIAKLSEDLDKDMQYKQRIFKEKILGIMNRLLQENLISEAEILCRFYQLTFDLSIKEYSERKWLFNSWQKFETLIKAEKISRWEKKSSVK